MKKIFNDIMFGISLIKPDKKKHIWAGFLITLLSGLVIGSDGSTFDNLMSGIGWGLLLGATIGLLKELVWDWALGKGKMELFDFIATVIGSAFAVALLGILHLIIN